ncbi:MAG: DNA polymerase III subunit chi [Gammaproteobacteria bacterium]|nr:DNA polymerase III subunit chi [Gammaproteobacteria bacterium]
MTRIIFYQISQGETALQFACRLIELVYHRGYRIHVHTGNKMNAGLLDEMLWSFADDRFIPHALYSSNEVSVPVRIGVMEEPTEHQEVMINLADTVPDFFSRFERVAEVVPADENSRNLARQNFRFYKDRGYNLDYHQIKARTPPR